MDGAGIRPKRGKIAAGVNQPCGHAMVSEDADSAIDRESLGDTAQVDSGSRMLETNPPAGKQLDRLRVCRIPQHWCSIISKARKHGNVLQDRSDRDVECTRRTLVQFNRRFEHLKGPSVHNYGAHESFAIEASDIAALIVETHEAVHFADSRKRCVDGRVHRGGCCIRDGNLDEGAEQRSGSAHAI
jgi:hypothetical protein